MFSRCLWLACALLTLMVSAWPAGTIAAPVPRAPAPPRWEHLLAWLPEDTETLIVAPLGFEMPTEKREAKDEKIDFVGMVQGLPVGPLTSLKDGLLEKQFSEQKVLCVVEGSRRFTKPQEFGLMPYEGCHIIQFDPEADAGLKKAIQTCLDKADKKIELAGVKVAVFTEDATWSFFVCRPSPGILMFATNQDYLEETLKRIDKKTTARALPADLPEWKHVDTKARVWGVRHYREEFAKDDPTSPLCQGGSDPAAVGFTFWVSASGKVEIRYLSDAKHALQVATQHWEAPAEGAAPQD